jgi:hypothetical protein
MASPSLYDDVDDAKVGGERLPELAPECTFVAEILKTYEFTTRQKFVYDYVELKVLESSGPNANPVGSTAIVKIRLGTDPSAGNVKNFLSSAIGVPSTTPKPLGKSWKDLAIEFFQSGTNPGKGVKVNIRTVGTTTEAGYPYVIKTFSPYEGEVTATAAPKKGATTATAK